MIENLILHLLNQFGSVIIFVGLFTGISFIFAGLSALVFGGNSFKISFAGLSVVNIFGAAFLMLRHYYQEGGGFLDMSFFTSLFALFLLCIVAVVTLIALRDRQR